MAQRPYMIQVQENDNVAITIAAVPKGTQVAPGITTVCDVPQGHKVALRPIGKGEAVVRYGVVIGYADREIPCGGWVNEHTLCLPTPPDMSHLEYATQIRTDLPQPTRRTFLGYENPAGGYAGIRNILGIMTTVQCVAGVVTEAVARIRRELLPLYPHVDDVVALNHPYGCGVAIDAPDAVVPIRSLRNLLHHPNFGAEILVVSLGCEKLAPERILTPQEMTRDNLVVLQDYQGFASMVDAIVRLSEPKLKRLDARRRVELPLSKLCIGMQCGGSDAFSGLTANPSAGYASDMLVQGGATVLFSEVTEVRDGVHLLAKRTVDASTCARLAQEMTWYDDYLRRGGADRSANTTPGNKQGGLSNIVEKAMGSIAKSGTAPIVEVLSPGETPTRHGLIYAATPGSDIVCGPCQLASGIALQVFMTGRGTPYGLAAAPVIKVSSRTDLKEKWPDLIDLNAGTVATGEATIAQVGQALFNMILDVADGTYTPWAERWGLHNDLCIFNPAPIT